MKKTLANIVMGITFLGAGAGAIIFSNSERDSVSGVYRDFFCPKEDKNCLYVFDGSENSKNVFWGDPKWKDSLVTGQKYNLEIKKTYSLPKIISLSKDNYFESK